MMCFLKMREFWYCCLVTSAIISAFHMLANAGNLDVVLTEDLMNTISKSSFTIVLLAKDDTITEAESSLIQLKPELEVDAQTRIVKLKEPTDIIEKYHIQKLPSILFFRQDKPIISDGPFKVDDIIDWITQNTETRVQILTDDSFEHLTQASTGATTGDWFVLFCNSSELSCESLQPIWDSVSSKISSRLNVAFVDSFNNPELTLRFNIGKSPEMIFFRLGKMYRYTNNKYDITLVSSFTTNWYRNLKAESVPIIPTAFDNIIDAIVKKIKELKNDPVVLPSIVMLLLPISIILAAIYAKQRYKLKRA